MRMIQRWKGALDRSSLSWRFKMNPNRRFCSSENSKKPTTNSNATSNSSSGSRNGDSSPPSLSTYEEQYKALQNLDFMTAARIMFAGPPKKKEFGLDFHLVQLFFVCLPSLAVYLIAQYARSEMRKMDAELEKKKQAEFEAQAKEMELKAAKEKEIMESNQQLLELKERVDKLEERVMDKLEEKVKEIVVESKKQQSKSTTAGQAATNK